MRLCWIILIMLLASGCQEKMEDEGLNVIVTIPPYKEFVKEIGKDKVNVEVMVPQGANPHTFEPSPQKLTMVSKGDLYIKVGTPIEFEVAWSDKLRSVNSNMNMVDSSVGISYEDPHVWVSPRNAKSIVRNINEALKEKDPANEDYYRNNMNEYIEKLDNLDKNITEAVSDMDSKNILVYHGAWENFAQDYNLTQIAIEEGGKSPSAKEIEVAIDMAKENNISVVFVSPQFSKKSANVIAREIDGRVVTVDPLAGDYINNMNHVADAFTS